MKPDPDIDPESAALLRQLHRELNGLTRRAKSNARTAEFDAHVKRRRTGSDRRNAGDGGQQAGRAARSGNPSTTVSEAGSARTSCDKDSTRVVAEQPQQQRGGDIQHPGTSSIPDAPDSSDKAVKGPASSDDQSHWQQEQSMQQRAGSKPKQGAEVAGSKSAAWYGKASARAADLARCKATEQARLKCFIAGSLWGVTLAPAALHSKRTLANALATAYPELRNGHNASCSAASELHVVFVGKTGRTYECPAHCTACSSHNDGWTCRGDDVVRLYVR